MTRRAQHATGPGNGPQKRSQRPPTAAPARRSGGTAASRTVASAGARKPLNGTEDRSKLTLAEVCAELGIERSTFYDWRAKNRAPRCLKLPNGQLRIRRSDLDDWLDSIAEDDA
jgi:excisionase family DNA binding protein